MSSTAPTIASSSSTMSLPSREMTDSRLFQFYLENFFKIPKEICRDIIYCQRALRAHIKVHQMVLDVFQQQIDADPEQKKRIVDELESEIYEINGEQSYLFLRLRRIVEEFMKMLKTNEIATDADITNAYISKKLVPLINDENLIIVPSTVISRNSEEKLIEKYFEVQKDTKDQDQQNDLMEIIELDDDDAQDNIEKQSYHTTYGSNRKREYCRAASLAGESILKSLHANVVASQPSLLKPFNQRMSHDMTSLDVKANINKPIKTLGDLYRRKKEEQLLNQRVAQDFMEMDVNPSVVKPAKSFVELYQTKKEEPGEEIELPVSTNVKMSRMNLRQALKRAQAAVRGPTGVTLQAAPPGPTVQSPPVTTEVVKKSTVSKSKASRAAIAAAAATAIAASGSGSQKTTNQSSSSNASTPERGRTPAHNYWPDEFEETRTKAEEYGQEMFLRIFDLFTPEVHARLQQRRSKRRRRCVQNNSYHYGKIDHPSSSANEPDTKKKRKAFLLSPQVKKTLPARRAKRSSPDYASTSRSASRSPDGKHTCNECLKTGLNLEQCEECKFYYHSHCHNEEISTVIAVDTKKNDLKKCPGCKKKQHMAIKKELSINKNLQRCAEDLELKLAKEKDRKEILERSSKSYKIQMNNIFKVVNSFKTQPSTSNISIEMDEHVINLD